MVRVRAAGDVVIIVLCAAQHRWLQAVAVAADLEHRPELLLVIVPGAIATAAMWWRRRYPVAVTAIAAAPVTCVSQVLLPVGFGLFTIALSSAATGCWSLPPVAVGAVPDGRRVRRPQPSSFDLSDAWSTGVFGALIWALWGAYVGARRDLVASLRDRAEPGRAGARTTGGAGPARRAVPDRQGDA